MKRLTIFLMFIAFASMYEFDKDDTTPQHVKTVNQEQNEHILEITYKTKQLDIPP